MPVHSLIIPGLLDLDLPIAELLPELTALASVSYSQRITQPSSEFPEAALVGLDPDAYPMSPGVLAVSAFGADPPERSVHFWLSLLSLDSDVASNVSDLPTPAESEAILSALQRLNTRRLTLVTGDPLSHALVWEDGSPDHRVIPPGQISRDRALASAYPHGDGEQMLRRYIEDSVNVLGGLEFNMRRVDAGRQPINLAWPWGSGFRLRVPNLSLRLGEPLHAASSSIRFQGLCRLVGFSHGTRSATRSWEGQLDRATKGLAGGASTIHVFDPPGGDIEETATWVRSLDTVIGAARRTGDRLLVATPGETAVAVVLDPEHPPSRSVPISAWNDPQALGGAMPLYAVVSDFLRSPDLT